MPATSPVRISLGPSFEGINRRTFSVPHRPLNEGPLEVVKLGAESRGLSLEDLTVSISLKATGNLIIAALRTSLLEPRPCRQRTFIVAHISQNRSKARQSHVREQERLVSLILRLHVPKERQPNLLSPTEYEGSRRGRSHGGVWGVRRMRWGRTTLRYCATAT